MAGSAFISCGGLCEKECGLDRPADGVSCEISRLLARPRRPFRPSPRRKVCE
ncbi:hypothetical protein ACLOJK_010732 [Asimina triloba]